MIVAIVFANLWGVLQLITLGSFARTTRARTVLAGTAVGLYLCAPLALLLQWAWIRPAALLTGASVHSLLPVASYTADPFIEEVFKVLPLALFLMIPAIRRQWSVTDCVLIGAAAGSGFGLAEDIYRFGASAGQAVSNGSLGGWMLPGIFATPFPGWRYTVTSWLPSGVLPNDLATLSLNHYPALNLHLAWSAVGGLAAGLF
jgi:RsiW-degrading membrane proteinase PrsW (M82 family)